MFTGYMESKNIYSNNEILQNENYYIFTILPISLLYSCIMSETNYYYIEILSKTFNYIDNIDINYCTKVKILKKLDSIELLNECGNKMFHVPRRITCYFKNNAIHRDNDLPALIFKDRCEYWYEGTKARINDLPTDIYYNGCIIWKNTKNIIHRDNDLPALINNDMTAWFVKGKLLRVENYKCYVLIDDKSPKVTLYDIPTLKMKSVIVTGEITFNIRHEMMTKKSNIKYLDSQIELIKSHEYISPLMTKYYFSEQNGEFLLHRDNDLPAIEFIDETRIWCQYNEIHRDNDLPAIEVNDGSCVWFNKGKIHRDDDNILHSVYKVNEDKSILKQWWNSGTMIEENLINKNIVK